MRNGIIRIIGMLVSVMLLCGCAQNAGEVDKLKTENVSPEFFAKVSSTWDTTLYFSLSTKGEISVFKAQHDVIFSKFVSGEADLELVCKRQLSSEELEEIILEFDNGASFEEKQPLYNEEANSLIKQGDQESETDFAVFDARYLEAFYDNCYYNVYPLNEDQNIGIEKVFRLIVQYSIGQIENVD